MTYMATVLDERLTDVDAYRRQQDRARVFNRAVWAIFEERPTITTAEARRIASQAIELYEEAGHRI